jgi:hypothetical protein
MSAGANERALFGAHHFAAHKPAACAVYWCITHICRPPSSVVLVCDHVLSAIVGLSVAKSAWAGLSVSGLQEHRAQGSVWCDQLGVDPRYLRSGLVDSSRCWELRRAFKVANAA